MSTHNEEMAAIVLGYIGETDAEATTWDTVVMIAGEEVVHETPPRRSATYRQIKHVIRLQRRTLIRFCGGLQRNDAARIS